MNAILDIAPVNVPKAADVLAGILREKILDGELQEGVDLPHERDLCAQAGLSRASVREALRILEGEGLIATRLGRNGGSAVVRPTIATIERSVGIFIRGQGIRLEAVLETRAAIEPPSARFAAQHRTDADIERTASSWLRVERIDSLQASATAAVVRRWCSRCSVAWSAWALRISAVLPSAVSRARARSER
jgi:DNA-binding FadR family transcriptional regulator